MTRPVTFDSIVDDARIVLVVEGEIDLLTAPELRARIESATTARSDVAIDLSKVTFFGSVGVEILGSITTRSGATLTLLDPSAAVVRTLDVLGWPENLSVSAGAAHA